MRPFHQVLANNLIQNVTNFTVWFALVFWAFLETRSVFVTGMIGVAGAIVAVNSPQYRLLSASYAKAPEPQSAQ